jgi:hypothetical protein
MEAWGGSSGAPARRRYGAREREGSGWEQVGGGLGGPVETGWLKG